MTFKVRIPVYLEEDGTTPYDADFFATNLKRDIKRTYKLPT
jgi:hypothetical protein